MNKLLLCAAALLAAAGPVTAAFGEDAGHGYAYQSGQELYEHVCQGCHMPDAKGAAGAGRYPSLSGNRKLQAGLYPVLVILRGQKAMPPFCELNDNQVAAVTNYIRSHFGNRFPGKVTVEQVKALRPSAVRQDATRPG